LPEASPSFLWSTPIHHGGPADQGAPPFPLVSSSQKTNPCLQIYVPDPDVSWVEATITKGHVVSETTVEVVIAGDETEECADKQPEAGLIRKIDVRSSSPIHSFATG
jgi:hypothetical protein